MGVIDQIKVIVEENYRSVCEIVERGAAERLQGRPDGRKQLRMEAYDRYYNDFMALEVPLTKIPRFNGQGDHTPEAVLDLPAKWIAQSRELRLSPDPDMKPGPGLFALNGFFKAARTAVNCKPRTFEDVLAQIPEETAVSAASSHSLRIEAAHPRVMLSPDLTQLFTDYRVEAGHDPNTGPWASMRPPREISANAFGQRLNAYTRESRGINAIWPNYLENRMPNVTLRACDYKATLWEASGQGGVLGDNANREGQRTWLLNRGQVFTPEGIAAILSALYFAKTGRDFFLDGWGRVAGRGVALAFYYDFFGVDAFHCYDADAVHDLRAVGSPESQVESWGLRS